MTKPKAPSLLEQIAAIKLPTDETAHDAAMLLITAAEPQLNAVMMQIQQKRQTIIKDIQDDLMQKDPKVETYLEAIEEAKIRLEALLQVRTKKALEKLPKWNALLHDEKQVKAKGEILNVQARRVMTMPKAATPALVPVKD